MFVKLLKLMGKVIIGWCRFEISSWKAWLIKLQTDYEKI